MNGQTSKLTKIVIPMEVKIQCLIYGAMSTTKDITKTSKTMYHNWTKLTNGAAAYKIYQISDIHQTLTGLFSEEVEQLFY